MFIGTMEQTDQFVRLGWKGWEEGLQKIADSQEAFRKSSLEALEKQQTSIQTMFNSFRDVEKEVKESFRNLTSLMKDQQKENGEKEVGQLFTTWNEKMIEIVGRLEELSLTPNKAALSIIEQSQQKLYESMKTTIEEQTTLQIDTKERIEDFVIQMRESQENYLKFIDEQTRQLWEVNKSV